jgi:type IV pilus assembly protein PilM
MRLGFSNKARAIVGIDVKAGSVAGVEVRQNGTATATRSGIAPLPTGVMRNGEVLEPQALGHALKALVSENGLAKTVRLGVGSQWVGVRTLRMPPVADSADIDRAVRIQASEELQVPDGVLDYEVVRHGVDEAHHPYMEVVCAAARLSTVRPLDEAIRAAGLKSAGLDLAAFGMLRALVEQNAAEGSESSADPKTFIFCELGDSTHLVVATEAICDYARVAAFGVEEIADRLAARRRLTIEHARKWLAHVGLESPLERIDGDPEIVAEAREILTEGAGLIGNELRLLVEYCEGQPGSSVAGIVCCGPGTAIPGLVARLEHEAGQPVSVRRPAGLDHLDGAAAARLTVPYGLALG